MAKRREERYRFDAANGKVFISDRHTANDILIIINATDGIILANQLDPGKKFTTTYFQQPVSNADWKYSTDGYTEVDLLYDTTGMSDTDELTIFIDEDQRGLTVRPYDFGVDAIERIRVSNPQSLIDADFEYGLQQSKWQDLGLNRNYPSFFELVGPAIPVDSITSQGAATYSVLRISVAAGTALDVGTPVSITGTSNSLGDGLFAVVANNAPTLSTFDVLAKGSIPAGDINNTYTVVKQGGVYAGGALNVSTMSGDGAGGNVTITFGDEHGLVPGSPILVVDTTAGTQTHEGRFFVNSVPDGTSIVYDAGQTVTTGAITTTNISVYAINDSFFIHRPFDGGVLMGPGMPVHGIEAKRQSKRYFRYQSGKGFLFSTGILFNPVFDISNATYSAPNITITTELAHGLQEGATVKLAGIDSANYNGTYVVNGITSDFSFTVPAATAPTVTPAVFEDQPRLTITNWSGSALHCGLFDDTNGVFWEYDGNNLAVVRRSSTFQLAGFVSFANGSNTITGTNTRFLQQLKVGDKIVVRGQTHLVTSIASDTTLGVTPANRGITVSDVKATLVKELRVTQSQFNLDRIDGTDTPSGYHIDLTKMQMVGIQYSWYGAGFIDFMVRGARGEWINVHRMTNNNVNDEAYMRSGNLPARYEVNNSTILGKLAATSGTSGDLTLADASLFPDASATYPEYVLITSDQSGTIRHEVISYTGKSGNTLTGTTRATSYDLFLSGSSRTFQGASTAYDHPAKSGVILLNTTCAPTVSHWGSAVIMDGGFDEDSGYSFNLSVADFTVPGGSSRVLAAFRPSPSVSNSLPGELGEREALNRSRTQLTDISINNNNNTNLEVTAILNPSNLGAVDWQNANTATIGAATVFQPSFAQYATTGGDLLSPNTGTPIDGEVLFRFLSTSGTIGIPVGGSQFGAGLGQVKELQNSILGGNNTYPDGPDVIVIYVTNNTTGGQSATASVDLLIRWQEAQA